MSEEIRINKAAEVSGNKASSMPWVILAVIVVIIVVLGFVFKGQLFGGSKVMEKISKVGGGYQAVFLTNGQVYFGKLSDANDTYATLSDIYYLQVIQQQPLQGTPQTQNPQQQTQPQISLVKLGQELHGPVDEMHISQNQILFYEDLKDDGNVVAAIKKYKAEQSATPKK